MDTLKDLQDRLESINPSYRSAPFWAWNDCLQPEELKRQLQDMKEEGIGGFFIHSREGLETEYLSDEWMRAVSFSVDKAKEIGLEAWIYDEDKWPSGSAGGLVSHKNEKAYTAKAITFQRMSLQEAKNLKPVIGQNHPDGTIIDIRAVKTDGETILNYCAYDENLGSQDWKIIVLRCEISGSSEWYNGYAPPDNLNPDAVRTFIELTHEKYKAEVGTEFGKTIKGFFTDEPNFCDFFSVFTKGRPWIPWSEGFEDYFRKKRGYDIREHLIFLFYKGFHSQKIRHDYWRTLTERFNESYVKQLYDWCDSNQLIMTGHMLYENDLGYSARVSGAAMPHYRYMHAPGIDLLGEQTQEYLTVKQCSSIANQFDRKTVLSETYGCTGWDFTFEGQKWLGDWQFVMGVNRRCQHLALYSIAGCRKRDYPPAFNYNTTWWKDNHIMEEYFARLAVYTTAGKVMRDILVIHPISSIWMESGSSPEEDFNHIEMNMGWLDDHILNLNKKGESYNRLAKMLLGAQFDFDFGDEMILSEEAKVIGDKLQVGECEYKIVIVPTVLTLFDSTIELLELFLKAGGSVIWVKPFITHMNGEENPTVNRLLRYDNLHLVDHYEELLVFLQQNSKQFVRITKNTFHEDDDILVMSRKLKDGYLLFVVNHDRMHTHEVKIHLTCMGSVKAVDLLNQTEQEHAVRMTEDGMFFIDTLKPARSRVYLIKEGVISNAMEADFNYHHPHAADQVWACLGPTAKITRTMENVLTLDQCQYKIVEGEWSPEMDVWKAQREIRQELQLQQIYYNGAPQRYRWIHDTEKEEKQFALRFSFVVRDLPKDPAYVVVEKPKGLQILCNNLPLEETEEYFLDRAMIKFLITDLKLGENIITIQGIYKNEMELEDIYVVGQFAVDSSRTIARESAVIHFGDWCFQGYYYYPGNLIYHFEIDKEAPQHKKLILTIGSYYGTLSKIRVNNLEENILMGRSYTEVDLTKYLTGNHHIIDIEVVGSPRNMLGPFHQTYTGCSRISWADFRTEGEYYTPDYVIKPYGLMGQIAIIEREDTL